MNSMAEPLANWWDNQPEPVRAVLDLACNEDDDMVERILRTFGAAEHVYAVTTLGDDLRWIVRLRADVPHEVLSAYYDRPWHGWDGDLVAEQEADALKADVLTRAQLVASLIERRVAA